MSFSINSRIGFAIKTRHLDFNINRVHQTEKDSIWVCEGNWTLQVISKWSNTHNTVNHMKRQQQGHIHWNLYDSWAAEASTVLPKK